MSDRYKTEEELRAALDAKREQIAALILENGYTTGHGDTSLELVQELIRDANELRERAKDLEAKLQEATSDE
jgi:hypothetical protein